MHGLSIVRCNLNFEQYARKCFFVTKLGICTNLVLLTGLSPCSVMNACSERTKLILVYIVISIKTICINSLIFLQKRLQN
jgi:hypothetical protein